jgi:hypothetical protein
MNLTETQTKTWRIGIRGLLLVVTGIGISLGLLKFGMAGDAFAFFSGAFFLGGTGGGLINWLRYGAKLECISGFVLGGCFMVYLGLCVAGTIAGIAQFL